MAGRKRIGPQVAAALVVAIGLATVWVLALLWIGNFVMQFWREGFVYENIEVMRDGTPVIQSRSVTTEVTYRTLDGQPLELESSDLLVPGTTFQEPIKPPGLYETDVPWGARIAGMSDFQRPPVSWYLVRDAEPIGHAYFVAYDQVSHQQVGYMGRNGFSRAMPEREQWFDLGRHQLSWGSGAIMSTGALSFGSKANAYAGSIEDRRLPWWVAYLIDGDRLVAVDLRTRSVQPIFKSPELLSLGVLYELPKQAAAGATAAPAAVNAQQPAGGAAPIPPTAVATESNLEKLQARIALRTTDRIIILDPPDWKRHEYILPEALRDVYLSINALPNGEMLLVSAKDNDRSRNVLDVTWIRPDGSIVRQREVALAMYGQEDPYLTAWLAVPVGPVPVGWLTGLGFIAPIEMLQNNKAVSFSDAYAKILPFAGLPLLAVLLIGAICALLTVRQQRKYRRPATNVWAIFVFLLGLPGYVAYLIEHRRAKLEACQKCGEIVPRDRDACAVCNTEFAPPPRVGTEIFA